MDARITAAIRKNIDFSRVPGAAVGISRDGKIIYARGFGKRNVQRALPADEETAFEIGSATKQFTAAEILQLQEAKRLSIDDRLAKYLPSFPHAKDVTLRQLLNQTSGMPDYLTDEILITPVVSRKPTYAELEARIKGPLHFTPGTKWEYSNANYLALGAVVASVSHVSWEAYTRAHIFARAEMTHSGFFSDEPHMPNFAQPYNHGADGKGALQQSPPIANGWAGGAGAIVSTLADMLSWDDALANGRIVAPADYMMMTTPPALPTKSTLPYGMGLVRDAVDGHQRIWHNGSTGGSHTMDACFPQDHLCIVVFENEVNASPENVSTAVFEAIVPEALAAAEQPAAGEDPAITTRMQTLYDQMLHNSIDDATLTQDMKAHLTPDLRQRIAAFLSPYGEPDRVIYKGKQQQGAETVYTYRFEFSKGVLIFRLDINQANLIAGAHLLAG